mmetsp:Transcript_43681/g.79704  ORF Transcript_43681/g.79704 Transcript_43681/m.79704 type:complete len:321 (-) Transcript_43681:35-997(-)
MFAVTLGWLFSLAALWATRVEASAWCEAGLKVPDLKPDAQGDAQPSVEVILAQAPLFSVNPAIGQKLGLIGLYHTALVLRQDERNWTLEFDSVTNVFGAIMPELSGESMVWKNAARYCLTSGIYNGRAHWTKSFDVVMRLTASQTQQLFHDFVGPLNRTDPHAHPLYQLWRLTVKEQAVVPDITCGDGVRWFLHAGLGLNASLVPGFVFKSTQTFVHAEAVEIVNMSAPGVLQDVVAYYAEWNRLVAGNQSALERAETVMHLLPMRYVYDSNARVYYRLFHNHFPWIEVSDAVQELDGPPHWVSTGVMQKEAKPLQVVHV